MYTEKVMDHFANPRNVGTLPDADGVGQVGNPVCGDMMTFYVKVKNGRLTDVKFQTFGCGAAIAVSSMVSEMAIGKSLDEAMAITNEKVAEELGGLPKNKMHCSNLGADALHLAIKNHQDRAAGGTAKIAVAEEAGHEHEEEGEAAEPRGKTGKCPYCDGPVEGLEKLCECGRCHTDLVECPACGLYTRAGEPACTHCGAEIKAEPKS
ncbi:MAG: Fe-S cluster assembly scaffold protein NifU [Candidatus Aminicenantes bacterium]|nr:Fe-S cluster assembly scaffold protein NifU [Candidatus Aminicenantes bacterium]